MNIDRAKYNYAVLFFLSIAVVIVNVYALSVDTVPLCFDEAGYHLLAWRYYTYCTEYFSWRTAHNAFYSISNFYPPLYPIFESCFIACFKDLQDGAILVNTFILLLLLFATYALARSLLGKKYGVLSFWITATSPAIFGFSRTNFPVLLVSLMYVLLCLSILWASRKNSLKSYGLVGAVLGMGLLSKQTFFVYALAPLGVSALLAIEDIQKSSRTTRSRLTLFALFIGLGIAALWYVPNVMTGRLLCVAPDQHNTYQLILASTGGLHSLFHAAPWIYYPRQFFINQVSPFYSVLFLFVLINGLRKKRLMRDFLFLCTMLPLCFFYLAPFKQMRYVVPTIPLIAIQIEREIYAAAWSQKKKRILFACIGIIGAAQLLIPSLLSIKQASYVYADYYPRREQGIQSPHIFTWDSRFPSPLVTKERFLNKDTHIGLLPSTPLSSALSYSIDAAKNKNRFYLQQNNVFVHDIKPGNCAWLNDATYLIVDSNGFSKEPLDDIDTAVYRESVRRLETLIDREKFEKVNSIPVFGDQIISVYMQKERIRDLEEVDKNAVEMSFLKYNKLWAGLDNGSLSIGSIRDKKITGLDYTAGDAITAARGLNISFYYGGRHYSTLGTEAYLEKDNDRSFTATFEWAGCPALVHLDVALVNDLTIVWDVRFEAKEYIEIEHMQNEVVLRNAYSAWGDLAGTHVFPFNAPWSRTRDLSDKTRFSDWVSLYSKKPRRYPPALMSLNTHGRRGIMLCQTTAKHRIFGIYNSTRALTPGLHTIFSGTLRFFSKQEELEKQAQRLAQSRHISLGQVSVYCGIDNIFFSMPDDSFQFIPRTSIIAEDAEGNISQIEDTIKGFKKVDPDTCSITTADYTGKAVFEQSFTVKDRQTIEWNIRGRLSGDRKIQRMRTSLLFDRAQHASWITPRERQVLANKTGWSDVVIQDYLITTIGISHKTNKRSMPKAVLFTVTGAPASYKPVISYGPDKAHLQFFCEGGNTELNNGLSDDLGSFTITLLHTEQEMEGFLASSGLLSDDAVIAQGESCVLEQGDLRLSFENGIVKVFWKDIEITDGFGMYTSVRANGVWHDSTKGLWEIAVHDDTSVTASYVLLYLPVEFTWKVALKDGCRILWDIDVHLHTREMSAEMDEVQASMMLRPEYDFWKAEKFSEPDQSFYERSGYFLSPVSDRWSQMWEGNAGKMCTRLTAASYSEKTEKAVPRISLTATLDRTHYKAKIFTTDTFFDSRALQFSRQGMQLPQEKGESRFFSGEIVVNASK